MKLQSIAKNDVWVEEPVTLERLHRALDRVAVLMAHPTVIPERFLPIYERLEHEIAIRQKTDSKVAAALEHARRLKARKAAPSS